MLRKRLILFNYGGAIKTSVAVTIEVHGVEFMCRRIRYPRDLLDLPVVPAHGDTLILLRAAVREQMC